MNIAMILEMAADAYGDRVAVTDGHTTLTYVELRRRALAAAELIKANGSRNTAPAGASALASIIGTPPQRRSTGSCVARITMTCVSQTALLCCEPSFRTFILNLCA